MKAIIQERYGSPDDLEFRDVEKPVAGDGDVLVRVRAASLHPDVWHVVTGRPWLLRLTGSGFHRPRNPIPGTDMAGIVESVGRGVSRFRPGDAVFGETIVTHQWINGGAFAEYVSVREGLLALKPDNITFEQAASVPTSGFIALQNLRGGQVIRPGENVLVNGAGGGVGSLALQIAKGRGARVTAVDSTRKLEMLRSLGADEVIDFTREDFTRRGVRYDFIFDVPGNHPFSACRLALTPGGRYVLIGHTQFDPTRRPVLGLVPRFFGLMFASLFEPQLFEPQLRLGGSALPTRNQAMTILSELLAARTITPVIDSTYPLSEVRAAFRRTTENETLGKVVLTMGGAI